MNKTDLEQTTSPTEMIINQITELADWRGEMLARLRKLILEADPEITEAWKWGTAVWTKNGLVCSAAAFKDHLKLNFFKGALLQDPLRLFNAGLDAKATRSIDFNEGDVLNEPGLKDLLREAVAANMPSKKK